MPFAPVADRRSGLCARRPRAGCGGARIVQAGYLVGMMSEHDDNGSADSPAGEAQAVENGDSGDDGMASGANGKADGQSNGLGGDGPAVAEASAPSSEPVQRPRPSTWLGPPALKVGSPFRPVGKR